jgi:hypothetical protein
MESLPACRAGIMVDNIIARDCMPIVEPIARMNLVGREQCFQKNLLTGFRSRARVPIRPILYPIQYDKLSKPPRMIGTVCCGPGWK